ncbi:hypothetical protein O181_016143 [Austropuccinia psidii MF-1]|uniref:Methyltransferase domain-containing protein n=1 Tax=Austropuccinia psidii MF-1 TaxID=1389203 RepID=A0A9Q3C4K2_9BASI|nr:hypothetical protein [Austropuccinia psidii MF-1]
MSRILKLPLPPEGTYNYPFDDPSNERQLNFLKHATAISDPKQLKKHLVESHERIMKFFPYPCIWNFDFARGLVSHHPIYPEVLSLAKKEVDYQKIFIDFGALLAVDVRQVISNGWKQEDVLAVDIYEEAKKLSCEMFKDVDGPPPYFIGDIFDSKVFNPAKPEEKIYSKIDLYSLKDLNPLKNRASFISCHYLFHLFGREDQERLASYCAMLLSDKAGSSIFGFHRGSQEEGYQSVHYIPGAVWYGHSVGSWVAMWEDIFEPTKVKIVADLKESNPATQYEYLHGNKTILWMTWSVTRL